MRAKRSGTLALLLASAGACSQASDGAEGDEAQGQTAAAAREAPPFFFRDATAESGLDAFRQVNGSPEKLFVVESVGGGVALFDAEGDGDLDAYLTNGSLLEGLDDLAPDELPRDALFANAGDGTFRDVTEAAGLGDALWTNGVRVVDLEGDGDADLYLTNYGPNVLEKNRGDGTFDDATQEAGIGDPGWSTGSAFLDHDRDGDLDLYVVNYIEYDEERMLRERPTGTIAGHVAVPRGQQEAASELRVMFGPRGLPPARDRFYVNRGDGTFRDASAELGVDSRALFGFQCVVFDYDLDGWIDVYVANDVLENLLWRNEEGRRFTDVALRAGAAFNMAGVPQGGMGAAVGDYDGDLLADLYVTNFVDDYSTLYRGRPGGTFVDATSPLGLNAPTRAMVGWGCDFADFDSDGDLEIYLVNGHVYPQVDLLDLGTRYRQRNQLFQLEDGRYTVPAEGGGPGFALEQASRGSAVGDVDGDGALDLLIGNLDGPPALLRNESPQGHHIFVLLVDAGANRDAIGARLVATVGEQRLLRLVGTAGSFLSSSDPRQHFGLGAAERIDELEITWPDGQIDRLHDLAAGRLYRIERTADGTVTYGAAHRSSPAEPRGTGAMR